MKIDRQKKGVPSQRWEIPIGEQQGHWEHPDALKAQVRVAGGEISIDVLERDAPRIIVTEQEAEGLAHLFARMPLDGGLKIAHALLDAAHMARLNSGTTDSRRTPFDAVAERKLTPVELRAKYQADIDHWAEAHGAK